MKFKQLPWKTYYILLLTVNLLIILLLVLFQNRYA